jgi:hypothetical protein
MRRPRFAQLSWSRQSGKVSKMVISNEAALSPLNLRRATYYNPPFAANAEFIYSYGFQLRPGSSVTF